MGRPARQYVHDVTQYYSTWSICYKALSSKTPPYLDSSYGRNNSTNALFYKYRQCRHPVEFQRQSLLRNGQYAFFILVSFGLQKNCSSVLQRAQGRHGPSLHVFKAQVGFVGVEMQSIGCLLYTSPSPRDLSTSRMPSSA